MPIHRPAVAALLLTAAAAVGAAEPVRIQPTVLPLLQTSAAKQGGESSGKPAPVERVPGPLVYTHVHRDADGKLLLTCREQHRTPVSMHEGER